jgi:AbrB family looped-hinge helix DNA binding protein
MNRFTSAAFHGAATMNDKGQVVIPASARKEMGLGAGEKLLVFGAGGGTLMLCKVSEMEKYASFFSQRLEGMRKVMESVSQQLDETGGDE